ncbi:hypothetical protein [Jutongia huaianensis]|uniref:Uncharacterized protein n=1 Tax=Jutongia huaianensis TaxID=2763668 RepID=A0ABR7N0B5_9FIRM|nr:hypothetical protein [Jutongia huaianensis]MBC8562037.1 hypothetical protein [Jutongia huaianensis]
MYPAFFPPELELAVRVLNINPSHNAALLESCTTLKQYMAFVTKVRECIDILTAKTINNPPPYMDRLRIAISEAVDYCIAQAIHNTITMLQSSARFIRYQRQAQ